MGTFRNLQTNMVIEINKENLQEFKDWINNDPQPSTGEFGYRINFSVAKDVPFTELVPTKANDTTKAYIVAAAILETLHQDENRIAECFNLAPVAPQIPLHVYNSAGASYFAGFYSKLLETLEKRPMSDNLIMVADNKIDIYGRHFVGSPENIASLPPEKRKALQNILDTYDRHDGYRTSNQADNAKIEFLKELFARGDLLSYNGLSQKQRQTAIMSYEGKLEDILRLLKDKQITTDILKKFANSLKYDMFSSVHLENNSSEYAYLSTEEAVKKEEERAKKQAEANKKKKSWREEPTPEEIALEKPNLQAAKNANLLPENYKRLRDILISLSKKQNKNCANNGFEQLCQEIGVKPKDSTLLEDVYLRTAHLDISEGRTQNLSVNALQNVLNRDSDGFYTRKITPEDIQTVEKHDPEGKKVALSNKTKAIINRNQPFGRYDNVANWFNSNYNNLPELSTKEQEAKIACTEFFYKVSEVVENGYMGIPTAFAAQQQKSSPQQYQYQTDRQNMINLCMSVYNAAQNKTDLTEQQKRAFNRFFPGREDFSAQDIIEMVNTKFEQRKADLRDHVEMDAKASAILQAANDESSSKWSAFTKIKELQDAHANILAQTKAGKKDEDHLAADSVEKIISRALNGERVEVPGIKTSQGIGGLLTSKQEKNRQESLNKKIEKFNTLLAGLSESDKKLLLQYSGTILSSETKKAAEEEVEKANNTVNQIRESWQIIHEQDDYTIAQQNAQRINELSPVPVENLSYSIDSSQQDWRDTPQKRLKTLESREDQIAQARAFLKDRIRNKQKQRDTALQEEAIIQDRQKKNETTSRTENAIARLKQKGGNNMLIEEIQRKTREASQKEPDSQAPDLLEVKAMIKKKKSQENS